MTPTTTDTPAEVDVPVREVSREEALAIVDRQARRYLGISGDEFIRRWKSGYWPDPDRVPGVIQVSMLLSDAATTESDGG